MTIAEMRLQLGRLQDAHAAWQAQGGRPESAGVDLLGRIDRMAKQIQAATGQPAKPVVRGLSVDRLQALGEQAADAAKTGGMPAVQDILLTVEDGTDRRTIGEVAVQLGANEQAINHVLDAVDEIFVERAARTAKPTHTVPNPPRQTGSKPGMPQQHSTDVLNQETNARFWAQTGYKVRQKLDMSNPTDKSKSRVWLDIFAKVKAEDMQGKLVVTYDLPEVQKALDDAALAQQATVEHVKIADKATREGDHETAKTNIEAANVAHDVGKQRAQDAAKQQPPTVSPQVVKVAVDEAHDAARRPKPGVIIFPVGHPVNTHPNAQPAHPDLTAPSEPDPNAPQPKTVEDHVALEQSRDAHDHAVKVIEQQAPGGDVIRARHKKIFMVAGGIAGAGALAAIIAWIMKSKRSA